MFSGIVQSVGVVVELSRSGGGARLVVRVPPEFGGFEIGESVAVNGACLTVVENVSPGFAADLSTETLERTGFGEMSAGARVNLERSLTPTQKISGHFVLGHVDRVGRVAAIERQSGQTLFRFEHPPDLARFVIEKGSIAVDGISLTVFDCRDNRFSVAIIPYTLEHTNLRDRRAGDAVNIECDMIGKYVVRACETLFSSAPGSEKSGVGIEILKRHGFVS